MTIGWKSPITKNVTTAIIKPEKFMTNRAIEVYYHLFTFIILFTSFQRKISPPIKSHKDSGNQNEHPKEDFGSRIAKNAGQDTEETQPVNEEDKKSHPDKKQKDSNNQPFGRIVFHIHNIEFFGCKVNKFPKHSAL